VSPDDAVKPVDQYRDYLLVLARLHQGILAKARLDPSDIVQMTLLKAHQCSAQFRGTTGREQAAWMRRILTNTMIDAARKAAPQERSLEAAIERSSIKLEALLDGRRLNDLDRDERLAGLAGALAALPDDQRAAIDLRYLQSLSIEAIGQRMNRSTASVGGLLQRGLRRLREVLATD
jgi:RNA polymerase sigma-70 factor (ECF subfamily)